jgi:hypothetical protein
MDWLELAQSKTWTRNRSRLNSNEIKEANLPRNDSARLLIFSFFVRNIIRYLHGFLAIFGQKNFKSLRAS